MTRVYWLRQFAFVIVSISMVTYATAQEARTRDPAVSDSATPRDGGVARAQVHESELEDQTGTEEGMPRMHDEAEAQSLWPEWMPPDRQRWILGVDAYNTSTGVVVTLVVPGSPASQIGLEPGDRIVNVDGFQIGWVRDRLYPLAAELQQRAGRRGFVTLLLQNVRNNQLLTRDVQLDRGRSRGPDRER